MRQQENERKAQLFSERLKAARKRNALSQLELAERVQVTLRSVQNWEGGEFSPHAKVIRKLCEVLQVTTDYLIGEGKYPEHRPNHYEMDEAKSGTAQRCQEHVAAFLKACGGDETRLGWTLVELKTRFPLDKWRDQEPAPARAMSAAELAASLAEAERKKVKGPGFH